MNETPEQLMMAAVRNLFPTMQAEALKHFVESAQETEKKLKKAETQVGQLTERVEKADRKVQSSTAKLDGLDERLGAVQAREDVVTEREKKMTELEIRKSCADEKVTLVQDMFTAVFRNTIVRENKIGNVPMENRSSDGSCYSSTVPVQLQHDKEGI